MLRTLILLGLTYLFALQLSAQSKRIHPNCPMDIIIALDFSGSELDYVDEIRTALEALTAPFELSETNMKIGIITFNRGAQVVLPLTGDTQKMIDAVQALNIARMVYATDIHSAVDLANKEFQRRSKPGVSKYFVLISDGDPHAHSRGYGFQSDLTNMEILKSGDSEKEIDPVYTFSLYTGRLSPYQRRFSEDIRKASINHMRALASDKHSFFYYDQYPMLVEIFERIATCL